VQVRKTAISSANVKKDVLSLCDQLRDKDLPPVGFRLEVRSLSLALSLSLAASLSLTCCAPRLAQQDDPKAGSLWKRIQ
jgi:hypothetical protein